MNLILVLKNILNLKSGNYCFISKQHGIKFHKYVNIKNLFDNYTKNKNFNIDFSNSIKNSISELIKKHSFYVPIAVMLSGGIDLKYNFSSNRI